MIKLPLDKINTTILGIDRLKKNLNINNNVLEYCINQIKQATNIIKKGKNYYIYTDNFIYTINSYTYNIITVKKVT